MQARRILLAVLLSLGWLWGGEYASAAIGLPDGSANIAIRQGNNLIVDHVVTFGFPTADLIDLYSTAMDGNPESFTQIGTIGPDASPIILKLTTDGDASFRMLHWYIDVPAGLNDIYTAGPTSLFDPHGGAIDVTISGLSFGGGVEVMPFICDNNSYAASFMRDVQGHFYETPQANAYGAYGNGVNDIQVPGEWYRDADSSAYQFDVLQSGTTASWRWGNILNPGLTTSVHNGLGSGVTPMDPGHVFELGLSVALVEVPEPGTLGLMVVGAMTLLVRWRWR